MCLSKRRESPSNEAEISQYDTADTNLEVKTPMVDVSYVRSTASVIAKPKIVVIGAGAAGIACAIELIDSGFKDVTVLEAENRVGGRIFTAPFADNVVDIGAQWVHGEQDNMVYKMITDEEENLLESAGDNYVACSCIRSNGQVVPIEMVTRMRRVLAQIFSQRHEDSESFEGSFGEYLAIRFFSNMRLSEFNDIDMQVMSEFFENFKKVENSITASPLDELSAKGFNDYWECPGDYLLHFKDKGFEKFIEVILHRDGEETEFGILEGKIVFGACVREIRWDRDDAMVAVCCENREEPYLADHVIVTVSLGVLKQSFETMFVPELPPDKVNAIQGLGFGCVAKVYLEFKEQFWPENWTGFMTLWCPEDMNLLVNTPRAWLLDVYGFYCVNYQPRVLEAWVVGKHIQYVEALVKDELQKDLMYLMRKFLPKWIIPEPVDIMWSSWSNDKHFKGAYSYRSLHTDKRVTSASDLMQPLTILAESPYEDDAFAIKPIVLFAGEATSAHYYGTVHGAVETGLREAGRITGYYALGL